MADLIGRTLNRLGQQLRGRLSLPGDDRYAAATAIWAKPIRFAPSGRTAKTRLMHRCKERLFAQV
jgi:hypothetical protein